MLRARRPTPTAAIAAGRRPPRPASEIAEIYERYEHEKRKRRVLRLRRPAVAVRRRDRNGRDVRRGPALALPAPVRRRVPGRDAAPGPVAARLARRSHRPVRRRRRRPGDLRVRGRRRGAARASSRRSSPAAPSSRSTTTTDRRRRSSRSPSRCSARPPASTRPRVVQSMRLDGPAPTVTRLRRRRRRSGGRRAGVLGGVRARCPVVGDGRAVPHQRAVVALRGRVRAARRPGADAGHRRASPTGPPCKAAARGDARGRPRRGSPATLLRAPRRSRRGTGRGTRRRIAPSEARRTLREHRDALLDARTRVPRSRDGTTAASAGFVAWLDPRTRTRSDARARRRSPHVPPRQGARVAGRVRHRAANRDWSRSGGPRRQPRSPRSAACSTSHWAEPPTRCTVRGRGSARSPVAPSAESRARGSTADRRARGRASHPRRSTPEPRSRACGPRSTRRRHRNRSATCPGAR